MTGSYNITHYYQKMEESLAKYLGGRNEPIQMLPWMKFWLFHLQSKIY